jgi:hypothetical protein
MENLTFYVPRRTKSEKGWFRLERDEKNSGLLAYQKGEATHGHFYVLRVDSQAQKMGEEFPPRP